MEREYYTLNKKTCSDLPKWIAVGIHAWNNKGDIASFVPIAKMKQNHYFQFHPERRSVHYCKNQTNRKILLGNLCISMFCYKAVPWTIDDKYLVSSSWFRTNSFLLFLKVHLTLIVFLVAWMMYTLIYEI